MATGNRRDWQMYQASLEEHVPLLLKTFLSGCLTSFLWLFSRDFEVETCWRRHKGDGENVFSKVHSSVSTCIWTMHHLLYEKCQFDIMQMHSGEYHKHSWIAMHCRMWILCALTLCWIANDAGQTCLLAWMPVTKNCTLNFRRRAENGCRLSHFIWSNP